MTTQAVALPLAGSPAHLRRSEHFGSIQAPLRSKSAPGSPAVIPLPALSPTRTIRAAIAVALIKKHQRSTPTETMQR
jgi:hypothetical protein